MPTYARYAIPVAHAWATNRVFNLILGDAGDNLAQPLSASGQDPATHKWGGATVDAEWLATFQNLGETLPTPEGGWPTEATESLPTLAEAEAAIAEFDLFTRTKDNIEEAVNATRIAMLAGMQLQEIVPPD